MITKTRQVDDCGNVSYQLSEDGAAIGVVEKTCGGWLLILPECSEVPVRSVKAAIDWFAWRNRVRARPEVTGWDA